MTNILVTGGAGYIGSHTAKALAAAGFTPVVLDDLSHGHRWAVRWGPLVEADVGDPVAMRAALATHKPEAVIHFAGEISVGESMENPGKYFRSNFCNTIVLLDAMQAAGVQTLVYSSTAAVYGTPIKTPIQEDHPLAPINPYGESKLFSEQAIARFADAHGLKWNALRYFNAAGADDIGDIGEDHDPETHLVPLVIDAALGRRPHIAVFGTDYATPDGTAIRDYIHVSDLADAHVAAVRRLAGGAASGAVNVGTGRGYSVREVIAAVERVSGRAVPVRLAPRRAGDPPVLVADPHKARDALGWSARRGLDEIVASALKWHMGALSKAAQ